MTLNDINARVVNLGDLCILSHKIRTICYLSKVQVIDLQAHNDFEYKYKVKFMDNKSGRKTSTLYYRDTPCQLMVL